MGITYGSVCSGIEAATTAWHPLGWSPRWFSEIEPFPSAVLAHHWPHVPNLGDFTLIRDRIAAGEVTAPDVLVGGTPCQAFSVAGLRKSMDDKRGQLTLEFVRLADALDSARSLRGKRPTVVVWENVPGVLNTPDNAFGCFLAGLVGEDDPLEPPGGRWTNAGYVRGPRRAVAWRILDAQYFGVAQRRRRVFVVASARDGFDPRQVLFEFDGLRRDSPPRREAGQGFAPVAGTLTSNGGGTSRPAGNCNELDFCVPVNGSHWDGGPHPSLNQSNNTGGVGMSNQEIFSQGGAYLAPHPVAPCLQAGGKAAGSATQQDAESGALVVQAFGGNRTSGPIDVAPALNACGTASGRQDFETEAFVVGQCATGDVFHTLRAEGFDGSEDGTGRKAGAVAVAFSSKDYGADAGEIAPTMRSMGHNESHANGGGQLAVACFKGGQGSKAGGVGYSEHVSPTLSATPSGTQLSPALLHGVQVRRLTPTECERLQGFPDGHTLIPWRGKPAENCPDEPRYKAIGNSMAVPVMRWIGARIDRYLRGL